MGSYPLVLDIAGRRAVVVGGGPVALRRVRGLLEAGAVVHVVAPAVLPELAALPVVVQPRPYADGDLAGAWLVHACTDDPAVNAAVAAEAERRQVPCVRATPAGGTARRRRWPGGGPVSRWRPMSACRPGTGRAVRDAIALLLGPASCRCGRTGPRPAAAGAGGAGRWRAGAPELITVRGRRLLAEADVVVVDRLAPRALLDRLRPGVELVDVGKAPHGAGPPQERSTRSWSTGPGGGSSSSGSRAATPSCSAAAARRCSPASAAGVPVDGGSRRDQRWPCRRRPGSRSPTAASRPTSRSSPATCDPTDPARRGLAGAGRGPGDPGPPHGAGPTGGDRRRPGQRGQAPSTPVAVVRRARCGQRVLVHVGHGRRRSRAGIRPPAVVVVGEVVGLRDSLGRRSARLSGG